MREPIQLPRCSLGVICAVLVLCILSGLLTLTMALAMNQPAIIDVNQQPSVAAYGLELIAETPEGVKVYHLTWKPKMVTTTQAYLAVSKDGNSVALTND